MTAAEGVESAAISGAGAESRLMSISPPPDRERQFAAARRRSVRVRILRKAILVFVFGAAAAMVAIAVLNPLGPKSSSLSFSDVSVSGTKISMARPRLAGFRSDGQPYVLTAERALQDMRHPTVAELEKVVGDMGTAGGETTRLTADAGVYDSVAERMKLSGDVRIESPRVEVRLRSVDIDFKTGLYGSDEPVEVRMGSGTTVSADRATARNNGQELIFEGRVRTLVVPQGGSGEDQNKRGEP